MRLIMMVSILLASGVCWSASKAEPPASSGNETLELRPITFMCHWQPQAQFVGYYLAKEKGFYRRYGLDVTIKHAGTTVSNTEMLFQGKVQFISTFLAAAIKLNGEKARMVNIAQLFRHSSLLIVARKNDGIKTVSDLNGRRVGVWYSDFEDIPLRFLESGGLRCHIVMIGGGVNMFLFGGVDAVNITSYNEFHSLLMAGVRPDSLTVFRMSENNLDIPEDGIYCRKEYYERNPDLCRDFARASLEGWSYAAQHPEEALELVERLLKEEHVSLARVHQRWMLREVLKLIFPPDVVGNAALTRENYLRTAELLKSSGKIAGYVPFEEFYYGNQ